MSNRVRDGIKETLLQQRVALDNAIERGNVSMQWAIVQRMCVLENALEAADGGAA